MKMTKKILIPILMCTFTLLSGCSLEDSSSSSSSSTSSDGGTSNVDNGGDGSTTNPGDTSPGNCTGTTSDGTGDGYSIHQYTAVMAGHQSWMPGMVSAPTIYDSSLVFKSDSRLKVRLKINSQPYPTAGEEYCHGRAIGQISDQYNYTKLRFRLHLRDIKCDSPDPQNSNKCLTAFYLGDRYRTQYIDPVSVDSCSPVIDLGSMRNDTNYGTTIEIEDVKADSTCQAIGTYCPAEKIVRAASCWSMKLQIVTDYTQDFKN